MWKILDGGMEMVQEIHKSAVSSIYGKFVENIYVAHGQVSSPASGERPKAAGYLACHRTRICMHHQCMENIYRHGVRFSLMTAGNAFQILHYRQGGSLYIHSVRYAVAGGWC